MTTPPDVTVIVPVYNAMPYLSACLSSLVGQSIAAGRMEIIAVDDGSTDGSGAELDRFALLHRDRFTILRQANSGGPAAPCNRALEVASGRYVYFVGADDYLWREALERLVAEADEYGSDVVAAKMVGVNGRYVHQALYARTDHDVQLFTSDLPWSMSNAKLYSRELVERHGLRFPENLPVNSDQAFTLQACVHAARISVLADDSYYFAVRRTDDGNITYRTSPDVNLACAADIMHRAATLLEAGPRRDAILRRHFAWELVKVLTVNFLALDDAAQQRLCRGVAELADAYLSADVRDGLVVRRRLLICLAQAGRLDILREVVREQAEPTPPPLVLDGDRAFVAHAGLRAAGSVDDRCYEILAENPARRVLEGLEVVSLGWDGNGDGASLVAQLRVGVVGPGATARGRIEVRAVPSDRSAKQPAGRHLTAATATTTVASTDDARATIVRSCVELGPLLKHGAGRWTVALCLDIAGTTHELPVPVQQLPPRRHGWHRGRPVRITPKATKGGRLQLVVEPLRWDAGARRQLAPLVALARRK